MNNDIKTSEELRRVFSSDNSNSDIILSASELNRVYRDFSRYSVSPSFISVTCVGGNLILGFSFPRGDINVEL